MTIIHSIDDFLFELFGKTEVNKEDLERLKEELEKYYTYGTHKPKVTIAEGVVTIEIDTPKIIKEEAAYNKVIALCEARKFTDARKLLAPLIKENPTNSEYYRTYGQALSEEGNQDEAINYLIDALRWNPKNVYALLMMGNIFAKYKDDLPTARKYYNQALKANPDDHISLNNVGGNLLQMGKIQEGIEYLERAYAIKPEYPNTTYGLALGYEQLGYPLAAFQFAIECVKVSNAQPQMQKLALATAVKQAERYISSSSGMKIVNEYKEFLEKKYGNEIKVEKDPSISTAAKIEFAENYDRNFHLIKYKPSANAVEHLIMHELAHLEFACEAREENANMLFISGADRKAQFIRDNEKELSKLKREGFSDAVIANFLTALYDGINRQVFNAPIDLFIEDYLFEHYKELRPFQFLSIHMLLSESVTAVTDKRAEKLTPRYILSASKVLNMVNAIQFKDLYGVDMIKQFNAMPYELKEAERMWKEFGEYRRDRKPGEEYEVVQHWGEDLRLEKYFELVDEEDFRNRPKTVEEVLQSASEDPYGVDVDKNFKEKQTQQFLQTQESIGTNQAVMWFMVDALKFFDEMPMDKIKEIAFQIAIIGTQGINPAPGHTYKVRSIPGKEFSGYHLLAYYYVSWKLAVPEMVSRLNLPYDKEYILAEQMFRAQK